MTAPAVTEAQATNHAATSDVAIIIVSYRSDSDLPRCLAALAAQHFAAFRIIIVENGGAAAHARIGAALPGALPGGQRMTYDLAPGNLGYAGGVNRGMAVAGDADAYWVLNPDTAPAPGALGHMVDRLDLRDGIGAGGIGAGDVDAVGCTLLTPDGRVAARGGGRWTRRGARVIALGLGEPVPTIMLDPATEAMLDYVSGASLLVSRRFAERCGPMREDYFLYCEEIEWCLRAAAAGLRLGYAPAAQVLHEAGTATGSGHSQAAMSRLAAYLNARNRVLLAHDQPGGAAWGTDGLILAHLLIRFGKRSAWRVLRDALAGWRAGVGGERGVPAWVAP